MTGGGGSLQHGSWQRGWALRFGGSHIAAFQRVEASASADRVGRPCRTPQLPLLCWKRWCLVCISFPCLCSAASVTGLRPIACPVPWCPSVPLGARGCGSRPEPMALVCTGVSFVCFFLFQRNRNIILREAMYTYVNTHVPITSGAGQLMGPPVRSLAGGGGRCPSTGMSGSLFLL